MKLSKVEKILKFGLENNLEIVSYGLAPNPNGFCYERHGKQDERVEKYFWQQLESLNKNEIEEMKRIAL